MSKRLLLAVLIAAIVLPSAGCGWRRGCNKCNVRAEASPCCPAPAQYLPPSCP